MYIYYIYVYILYIMYIHYIFYILKNLEVNFLIKEININFETISEYYGKKLLEEHISFS